MMFLFAQINMLFLSPFFVCFAPDTSLIGSSLNLPFGVATLSYVDFL